MTKRVKFKGKTWILPEVISFEGLNNKGMCLPQMAYYDVVDHRPPLKGEWYISGARPQAWRAFDNYTDSFLIAIPRYEAKQATGYTRGRKL